MGSGWAISEEHRSAVTPNAHSQLSSYLLLKKENCITPNLQISTQDQHKILSLLPMLFTSTVESTRRLIEQLSGEV